jgi:hypothetical protein
MNGSSTIASRRASRLVAGTGAGDAGGSAVSEISSREAIARVQKIHTATAAPSRPKRSPGWLSGGISAKRRAIPV